MLLAEYGSAPSPLARAFGVGSRIEYKIIIIRNVSAFYTNVRCPFTLTLTCSREYVGGGLVPIPRLNMFGGQQTYDLLVQEKTLGFSSLGANHTKQDLGIEECYVIVNMTIFVNISNFLK